MVKVFKFELERSTVRDGDGRGAAAGPPAGAGSLSVPALPGARWLARV
jgi:hypothetical protein